MSTYGGVGEIRGSDEKKGRSALLAGLGAVSALLVIIAFAASHLTTSQVRACLDSKQPSPDQSDCKIHKK